MFKELVIGYGIDYACLIYGVDKNIYNNLTLSVQNDQTK